MSLGPGPGPFRGLTSGLDIVLDSLDMSGQLPLAFTLGSVR